MVDCFAVPRAGVTQCFPSQSVRSNSSGGGAGGGLGGCNDMIHLFVSFEVSLPPYFGVTEWKFCQKMTA